MHWAPSFLEAAQKVATLRSTNRRRRYDAQKMQLAGRPSIRGAVSRTTISSR